MGGHVAADANLSLRLVALAAAGSNLPEAQSYACGSRSKRQELKDRFQERTVPDSHEPTHLVTHCGMGGDLSESAREAVTHAVAQSMDSRMTHERANARHLHEPTTPRP